MKNTSSDDNIGMELISTENILSAELYLHISILQALRSLSYGLRYGNFYDSLVERVLQVDQIEKLAIALGYIEEEGEYKEAVEKYTEKLDKDTDLQSESKNAKLIRDNKIATYKLMKIVEKIAEKSPKVGEPIL